MHELHVWRLDQHKTVATAHVVVSDPDLAAFMARAHTIGECLHAYGIHSTTLQPELLLLSPVVSDSSSSSSTSGGGGGGTIPDAESTGRSSSGGERSGEGTVAATEVETEAEAEVVGPVPCQIVCGKGRCGHLMCCSMGVNVTV